jgi:dTDP-4-dehydrorhamnose reductase
MIKGRDRVFISGQEGMVGSAIFNLLKKKKINILSCKRSELDIKPSKLSTLNIIELNILLRDIRMPSSMKLR